MVRNHQQNPDDVSHPCYSLGEDRLFFLLCTALCALVCGYDSYLLQKHIEKEYSGLLLLFIAIIAQSYV